MDYIATSVSLKGASMQPTQIYRSQKTQGDSIAGFKKEK